MRRLLIAAALAGAPACAEPADTPSPSAQLPSPPMPPALAGAPLVNAPVLDAPVTDTANVDTLAYAPQPGAQLPLDAALRDETGADTTLGQLLDHRPAIVALDYLRCPTVCGVTLAGLAQAVTDASLKPDDATVLVVSIDPRETAAEARVAHADYVRRYPATTRWRFATGPAPQVRRIATALGFNYRWEPRAGQYIHSVGVAVIAPDGRASSYLLGLDPPAAAVRRAVDNARAGTIAARPSLLRLICFGGDPADSRTRDVLLAIKLGAAAMFVFGASWLGLTLRRERA